MPVQQKYVLRAVGFNARFQLAVSFMGSDAPAGGWFGVSR